MSPLNAIRLLKNDSVGATIKKAKCYKMLHYKKAIKQMAKSKTKFSLKKEAMLIALERSLSVVSSACSMVKVSRLTHYRWMKQDSRYRQAVEEIEETSLDLVESKLLMSIGEGSVTATIFYLKTKGKRRGYAQKGFRAFKKGTLKEHAC